MQYKHFPLSLKAGEEDRIIEGLGSVFGNVDSYGDIVLPGAFAKSISGRKPVMLWQHRSDMPVGVWDQVSETPTGLQMKGRILDTTCGNDAYTLVKAGAINGLSIGYSVKDFAIDQKTGNRLLKQLDLYEVSLVTFPANERATISSVKSASDDIDAAVSMLSQASALIGSGIDLTPDVAATISQMLDAAIALLDDPQEMEGENSARIIEKRLRDAGFSRNEAKKLVAGGHKALTDQRDADCSQLAESLTNATNILKGFTA